MARKILLLDQFCSVSPYSLHQHPEQFETLVTRILTQAESGDFLGYHKPKVLEVDDSFVQPMATTAIEAGSDGRAQVWRMRWDSSG
jgi:hypothetical protein